MQRLNASNYVQADEIGVCDDQLNRYHPELFTGSKLEKDTDLHVNRLFWFISYNVVNTVVTRWQRRPAAVFLPARE